MKDSLNITLGSLKNNSIIINEKLFNFDEITKTFSEAEDSTTAEEAVQFSLEDFECMLFSHNGLIYYFKDNKISSLTTNPLEFVNCTPEKSKAYNVYILPRVANSKFNIEKVNAFKTAVINLIVKLMNRAGLEV